MPLSKPFGKTPRRQLNAMLMNLGEWCCPQQHCMVEKLVTGDWMWKGQEVTVHPLYNPFSFPVRLKLP